MNKLALLSNLLILSVAALLSSCSSSNQDALRKPIIFSMGEGSLPAMDIDDLILQSNFIGIGIFDSIPPSQWNTSDGNLPENVTNEIIWGGNLFIYTEQVFQPNLILKPDPENRELLVRSFGGKVGQDIMEVSDSEVKYTTEQEYLLFLSYYPDRVEDGTPGYYVASGSIQGVYNIENGIATSFRDQWTLDELVSYIQGSKLSKVNVPDTPEVREIINQIEKTFDIEARCNFDYSIFPSIYVNDPRYPVNDEKLGLIRKATDNLSLESAGYLDYKMAFYPWWLEGKRQWEEIYSKAKAENREVSEEERQSFLASKWGSYPGGSCFPERPWETNYISVRVENEVATVVLGIVSLSKELTLVNTDGQWLIAQEIDLHQ